MTYKYAVQYINQMLEPARDEKNRIHFLDLFDRVFTTLVSTPIQIGAFDANFCDERYPLTKYNKYNLR